MLYIILEKTKHLLEPNTESLLKQILNVIYIDHLKEYYNVTHQAYILNKYTHYYYRIFTNGIDNKSVRYFTRDDDVDELDECTNKYFTKETKEYLDSNYGLFISIFNEMCLIAKWLAVHMLQLQNKNQIIKILPNEISNQIYVSSLFEIDTDSHDSKILEITKQQSEYIILKKRLFLNSMDL